MTPATPPPFPDVRAFLRRGGRPRVIAHRGFSAVAPENTRAAFRRAIEAGADMIELDVFLTADGAVAVLHDATLGRTTNGAGPAAARTMAELARLDAGSWFSPEFAGEPIPTLAEVLALVAPSTILLNVEIKSEAVSETIEGGVAERTLREIARFGMRERTIVSSFHPLAIVQSKRIDPGVATAALFDRSAYPGATPAEILERTGADAFNLSDAEVSAEAIRSAHEAGAPVAVYTVDDPARMRELFAAGADAIFTNRPDAGLEAANGRG